MSTVTELGRLIDCTEEQFLDFCKSKDVGYLSSFHNLMVQTYNEVQHIKNELVEKMATYEIATTEDSTKTLEGLYLKLMRIEQRVFMLKGLIKDRSLKS